MPCEELEKLRTNIRKLQAQMKEIRQTSRSAATGDRRDTTRHHHVDSADHLKRRIARAAAVIEHHVAKHGCTVPE
ncbi:hypothetical protein [Candidatus Korobacter versatilis]|uniref:hypothetical protein n=1 Tax=Candidatus Korobacter versatilis TaxID=658062 RepID=UPI00031367F3|nr:hypothetical protein [Candidatus Koribacter versatilis]